MDSSWSSSRPPPGHMSYALHKRAREQPLPFAPPSNEIVIPRMYNDNASEAPLYLVPNIEGTGKRLVRRPHPPPTTAPLPDDFDAITETRDSTTIYDDAPNSALDIDYYDDITVAPAPVPAPTCTRSPMTQPIHAPLPMPAPTSPPRNNPTSPPRQRRAGSPSHSLAGPSPDVRGPRRSDVAAAAAALSAGKARSVAGDRDRDRGAAQQRRSLGAPPPMPPLSSSGKGPAMGRNQLVEKMVLEDGPERTISVWREHVAKNANEAGGSGGAGAGAGAGTNAANASAANGDGGGNGDGEGRSDLDSHVGRRRVSTDNSRRRVDSLVQGASGSPSVKSKGHRSRESAEFTEVSRSPLQPAVPTRSSTPQVNGPSQPTTPQKSQRRPPRPTSPSVGPKGTEYSGASGSSSDATSQTKVASVNQNQIIESVLSSCQPSLLHLLPILEELGVRRSEHMTALARMREGTRDREVKEEALRKGVTVVEWAILIDKLQSL
ncbi:hypothetical protein BJV74DRAFT_888784 [Russula compacta]|nr:hypothetical protein BJV74DRAFT_888784 [Russula compacta]